MTPSMRVALDDLNLENIAVIYPGDKHYPIAPKVAAVPLRSVADGTLFHGMGE